MNTIPWWEQGQQFFHSVREQLPGYYLMNDWERMQNFGNFEAQARYAGGLPEFVDASRVPRGVTHVPEAAIPPPPVGVTHVPEAAIPPPPVGVEIPPPPPKPKPKPAPKAPPIAKAFPTPKQAPKAHPLPKGPPPPPPLQATPMPKYVPPKGKKKKKGSQAAKVVPKAMPPEGSIEVPIYLTRTYDVTIVSPTAQAQEEWTRWASIRNVANTRDGRIAAEIVGAPIAAARVVIPGDDVTFPYDVPEDIVIWNESAPVPVQASRWIAYEHAGEYREEVNFTTGSVTVRSKLNADLVFPSIEHAMAYDQAVLNKEATARLKFIELRHGELDPSATDGSARSHPSRLEDTLPDDGGPNQRNSAVKEFSENFYLERPEAAADAMNEASDATAERERRDRIRRARELRESTGVVDAAELFDERSEGAHEKLIKEIIVGMTTLPFFGDQYNPADIRAVMVSTKCRFADAVRAISICRRKLGKVVFDECDNIIIRDRGGVSHQEDAELLAEYDEMQKQNGPQFEGGPPVVGVTFTPLATEWKPENPDVQRWLDERRETAAPNVIPVPEAAVQDLASNVAESDGEWQPREADESAASSRTADMIPSTGEALVTEEANPNEDVLEIPEYAFTQEELVTGMIEIPARGSFEGVRGPADKSLREVTLEAEVWECVQALVTPLRASELVSSFRRISAGECVCIPTDVFGPFQVPIRRWSSEDDKLLGKVREYIEGRLELNHQLNRERTRLEIERREREERDRTASIPVVAGWGSVSEGAETPLQRRPRSVPATVDPWELRVDENIVLDDGGEFQGRIDDDCRVCGFPKGENQSCDDCLAFLGEPPALLGPDDTIVWSPRPYMPTIEEETSREQCPECLCTWPSGKMPHHEMGCRLERQEGKGVSTGRPASESSESGVSTSPSDILCSDAIAAETGCRNLKELQQKYGERVTWLHDTRGGVGAWRVDPPSADEAYDNYSSSSSEPDSRPRGDVETGAPTRETEAGHQSSETIITVTTSHDGKAQVTISVNQPKGNGRKDDDGDDGDGNGDDDDEDLAKAFDELAIDICEYDRVWDKRLNGGNGAYRRCQKPKAEASRYCKCHRDMLIRHAGLGIRQALPKTKSGPDQHRQRRK